MEKKYRLTVKYIDTVLWESHTKDIQFAMAKITHLIQQKFPYALGEIIDIANDNIVFECKRRPIC